KVVDHLVRYHGINDYMYVSSFEGNSDKYNAYQKIFNNFGIEIDKNMILYGECNEDIAAIRLREYIKLGNRIPKAIICECDTMAIGIIRELKANGYSIPNDVIVTGFGGTRFSHANNPSLTTVAMPYYEAGEKAIDIIPEVMALPRDEVKNYIINNKLVISESCGCFEKGDSDDNNLISFLYQRIDDITDFSVRLIRMSEKLNSAVTIKQIYKLLEEFVEDIYADKFYLCIADKFDSCIEQDGLMVSKNIKRPGYPEKMTIKIRRENNEYLEGFTFETKDIIPALLEENDDGQTFYFAPIHYQEVSFGYICLSVDDHVGSISLFNSWRIQLSSAMENARIREELTSYSRELEKMYVEDMLTGLYNRRGLYNWADEIYRKACDSEKKVMVFVTDLDELKPINDLYGHIEGDNALIQVGRALDKAAVNGEICSRFGGDEFEVIGYDYTEELAQKFVQSFEKNLEEYNKNSQKPYRVSSSWGYVVKAIDSSVRFDEFIMLADKNMYAQKEYKKIARA
ncbi:MAG: diguanylate cyclase, partial [Clostridiales bacterium]|nr:diguanylate cyclase [Clostridiales bacterium]